MRRLARGLVPPVALLVLVGTLGSLQYRWLGRVSEAEREQLRQSLDRRAREFADEFDREITRLYQGLQPATPIDPAGPEALAQKYDQWAAATSMPSLVKALYYAKATPPGFALYRYNPSPRTLSATDWPGHLDVIRRRLTGTIEEKPVLGTGPSTKVIAFSSTSVVAEIPALVISLPISNDVMLPRINTSNAGARIDHDFLLALRQSHNHIIIELDSTYLATEVLPALITRHFSESGAVPYRVSILGTTSQPIASRNVADGDPIEPTRADVTWPFFAVRPDSMRTAMLTFTTPVDPGGGRGAAVARPQASMTGQIHAVTVGPVPTPDAAGKGPAAFVTGPMAMRTTTGHWRLLVQHSAGSLDAAVAAARRRNLWLSFGILAVLATSVGLIAVNARRSERLAAQQMDFVAAVSHELRTPLAVIRSAAQNLSAGVVHDAGQARRYGDLIETEGRRLTEMVEQVLEYAGLEAHRRPPLAHAVDAGRVVSDSVSSCSALFAADGFDVAVTVAPDLPAVTADEGALRRAMTNLLMNALKHASSGRSVAVDVRAASSTPAPGVEIAVSDHGPGIAAEDLGHIFEPFYRGRRATEHQIHGNGLGLSLVKRIVEVHGGRVTVKSAPGAGATFTLHLPAAPAPASAQPLETAAEAGG